MIKRIAASDACERAECRVTISTLRPHYPMFVSRAFGFGVHRAGTIAGIATTTIHTATRNSSTATSADSVFLCVVMTEVTGTGINSGPRQLLT